MAIPVHQRSVSLEFARPFRGIQVDGCSLSAWSSRNGGSRGPLESAGLVIDVPPIHGTATQVEITGVFAVVERRELSPRGSAGCITVEGESEHLAIPLIWERHFTDAESLESVALRPGDGTSLDTRGTGEFDGRKVRIDRLTVDLPFNPRSITISGSKDTAALAVLEVHLLYSSSGECPFHSRRGGISLAEVPALVRLGDRVRFQQAAAQLESALRSARDLDDARGQALTFIAVLTAAALEAGASSALHRVQLDAARELDRLSSSDAIAASALRIVTDIANPLFSEAVAPTDALIDRALAIIDRNFGKQLTDDLIAEQLGLSTSHFRFLFRAATGQPFHRFLVSKRLEHGRRLLVEAGLPVGTVAHEVGFASASHFSRAFSKRFGVSPASLRRTS